MQSNDYVFELRPITDFHGDHLNSLHVVVPASDFSHAVEQFNVSYRHAAIESLYQRPEYVGVGITFSLKSVSCMGIKMIATDDPLQYVLFRGSENKLSLIGARPLIF